MMFKAMWKRWSTPTAPRSDLIDMRCENIALLSENARLEDSVGELDDANAQLQADLDEAKLERDAMRIERDKAVGKFEYVEAIRKTLETRLVDRDNYLKYLEGELKRYMDEESEDKDDDFDSGIDDEDDFDDDLCFYCGMELDDCDCDEEEDDDECGDDE